MKKTFHNLTGHINNNSDMVVNLTQDYLKFLSENKGKRTIVNVQIFDLGTTCGQRGYYFDYIVPEIRRGMIEQQGDVMTLEGVDDMLRRSCPLMWRENIDKETCKCKSELLGISDLSILDMANFIDWCIRYASENLCIYIEDAR